MNTISTNLTTSGNSVAVRLPKELLRMSGLSNRVTLEAKQGKIIISNHVNVREGWKQQIEAEITANGLPTTKDKYGDMQSEANTTLLDGIE